MAGGRRSLFVAGCWLLSHIIVICFLGSVVVGPVHVIGRILL